MTNNRATALFVLISLSIAPVRAEVGSYSDPSAMREQKDPMLNEIRVRKRPKYTAYGDYGGDNKHRRDDSLNQALEFLHFGNTTWRLVDRLSEYRENGIPSVHEHAAGLGINQQFGLYHNLDLRGMAHFFSNDLATTYSTSGSFDSIWTDSFQTHVSGERAPVYTARALDHEINAAWGELKMDWRFSELWSADLRGRRTNISDDNRRNSANVELSRSLKSRSGFRIEYLYTTDDMKTDSLDYYSPHHLQQHQLGFDWPIRWEKDARFDISYLPGIGKETNSSTRVVHSVSMELRKTWKDKLVLGLAGAADTTPTYKSARGKLNVEYRF